MRRLSLLIISIIWLTACTSGSNDPQVQEVTRTPVRNFPTTAPTIATTATPTSIFASIGDQNPQSGCNIPSGWQAYFVQSGDTLGVIADSIGSTVTVIQQGNCLTSETIFVQQLLFLPSLPAGVPTIAPSVLNNLQPQSTTVATSVVVPAATSTAVNCPVPPGWVAYIVQVGDTLGIIANSTSTTVGNLQNGNCLGSSELIFVGQTLYLPRSPSNVATAIVFTPTPNIGCAVPTGWSAYTIQAGDTLGALATTYNTTVETLVNGNCLSSSELIFVGQTIYLPIGVSGIIPTSAPTLTPVVVLQPSRTPTASFTPLPELGLPAPLPQPVVRPTQVRNDGALVTLQPTIELDVGEVADADRVIYLAATDSFGTNAVQIGVDTTPFDGTRVVYEINDFDPELYIYAVAENQAGTSPSPSVLVVYDPTFNLDTGQPVVSPFVGFDGSIYIVEVGTTSTVTWAGVPSNAMRVDFYIREQNTNRLIGSDVNLADGATIVWQIQQTAAGELFARATLNTGQTTDSDVVFISAEDTDS